MGRPSLHTAAAQAAQSSTLRLDPIRVPREKTGFMGRTFVEAKPLETAALPPSLASILKS
jgi:hypothetical protein